MKKKPYKVVGIGEVLWDILPEGRFPGGAPANFAFHASRLDMESYLISAIGKDEPGKELKSSLDRLNLKLILAEESHPTGTVIVDMQDGIPSYTITENVAWDFIRKNAEMEKAVKMADAICFGSLAQRNSVSQETILDLIEQVSADCLVVFDANLRQSYYSEDIIVRSLISANILKINAEELEIFTKLLGLSGSVTDKCKNLLTSFGLLMVALTDGDKGSHLFVGNEYSYLPVKKIQVADTVGAGDSFTAALVSGVLNGLTLGQIHSSANEVSAFVCTQKGAIF